VAPVEAALRRAVADLSAVKARWALVGGLAVSARTIPRFTKDLDFAIAVADDAEAEKIVHQLRSRDYRPVEVLEQDYVERLSGVRLAHTSSDVVVDLLRRRPLSWILPATPSNLYRHVGSTAARM
jgi:hypothetical protein